MTDALTGDGAPRDLIIPPNPALGPSGCTCVPDPVFKPCVRWTSSCTLHGEGSEWWERRQHEARLLAAERERRGQ